MLIGISCARAADRRCSVSRSNGKRSPRARCREDLLEIGVGRVYAPGVDQAARLSLSSSERSDPIPPSAEVRATDYSGSSEACNYWVSGFVGWQRMPEGDRTPCCRAESAIVQAAPRVTTSPMRPAWGARTPTAVSAGSSSVLNIKSKTAGIPRD